MSQENNNNSHSSGGQGRQGGNNRNRNQNRNRNRNSNRNSNRNGNSQGGGRSGNRSSQGGGGQRRRQPKPAPLTAWEKILKFLGLYKAPTRPPRRRPGTTTESAPKTNVRNARGKQQGERKKQPSGPVPAKGRGAGEKGKDFPVETPRLYVGNLSYDANEHDLEELFKGIGTVKNVEIIYNRQTHRSRGYGFIQMLNVDDAQKAVEVLHDQPFMGRDMIVNGASSKPADTDRSSNDSDRSPGNESSDSEDKDAAATPAE